MTAAEHPHFCDCDGCLNGSGGLVLPGAGVVVSTRERLPGRGAKRWPLASVTSAGRAIEMAERARERSRRK